MPKVLIISYPFPPKDGVEVFRVAKFAKYLTSYEFEPHVMSIATKHYKDSTGNNPSLETDIEHVPVKRVSISIPSVATKYQGIVSQGNPYINLLIAHWIPTLVNSAQEYIREHDIDIVLYNGPPFLYLVSAPVIKQLSGVPYVVDMRDPWSWRPYGTRSISKRILAKTLESFVFRSASKIVVASKPMEEKYCEIYPECEERLKTITNGFDTGDYTGESDTPQKAFEVIYVGKFSSYRDPEPFIKAFSELINDGYDLQFTHLGKKEDHVIDLVKKYNIKDNVEFAGYVSLKTISVRLQAADLALAISGGAKFEMTTKIFDYIACNTPILAIGPSDGAMARIVDGFDNGHVVPNDGSRIKTIIEDVNQKNILDLGTEQSRKQYHRKELTAELATVLKNVMQ